jgi:hypothetical protein
MNKDRTGQIAVIFVSFRNAADAIGYGEAAAAMDALAAAQPGYRGVDSAREAGGMDITGLTTQPRSPGATIPITRRFASSAGRSGTIATP